MTTDEIHDAWPNDKEPSKWSLEIALNNGVKANRWQVGGAGKKGDPHRYRRLGLDVEENIRTPFDREPSLN